MTTLSTKPLLARIVWGRFLDKPDQERHILEKLIEQTPGGHSRWGEVQFTIDPVENCDFLLIADLPNTDLTVTVPPDNIWSFTIEPPNEYFWRYHLGHPGIARTFTSSSEFFGDHLINVPVPINWHIGLSFDQLINHQKPEKLKTVSFITSSLQAFAGHRARIEFTRKLMQAGIADIYGRGIAEIPCKWDAISQYESVVVVENFQNSLYWSEKIADVFLGFAMPIYFGCTRILDYFPEESLVRIDISDFDVIEKIQEIILQQRWVQASDAIIAARNKVLYEYNFFAYFESQIRAASVGPAKSVTIPAFKYSL